MLLAGLTGGLGCGKTFVAQAMRDLGAHILEADDIGHEVLLPSGDAYAPTLQTFGAGITGLTGHIDRAKLAARVFGKPAELTKLNAIVHPTVRAHAARRAAEIAAKDPHAVIVYVAAILLESGGLAGMGKLIVVSCTPEQQRERALERPGATAQSVEARIAHQLPLKQKIARADYVIDASGTKEETLRQTKIVFEQLRKLA